MYYEGYDVNGFRFHTEDHAKQRSRENSGVFVKGECTDGVNHDYYGVLKDIIELEYEGIDNRVVLFKCHWFNIPSGVRVDHEHGIVEVNHTSTLQTSELFVFACQANQVFYIPYASQKRERRQWWIAMKSKRKGNLGVEDVAEANQDWFQEEQPECPISISIGQQLDWDTVVLRENEDDIEQGLEQGAQDEDPEQDDQEEYIDEEIGSSCG